MIFSWARFDGHPISWSKHAANTIEAMLIRANQWINQKSSSFPRKITTKFTKILSNKYVIDENRKGFIPNLLTFTCWNIAEFFKIVDFNMRIRFSINFLKYLSNFCKQHDTRMPTEKSKQRCESSWECSREMRARENRDKKLRAAENESEKKIFLEIFIFIMRENVSRMQWKKYL